MIQFKQRTPSMQGLVAAAAAEGGVTDLSSSSTPHANGGIPAITITTTSAAANGDGASMGPTEDTTTASTSGLLRRWEVQPTASRLLQGLRDVAMLVVAVLPFLVLRATRYVIGWLGISEHRWKGAVTLEPLSREDKQQLSDVIVMLRSNKIPESVLRQAVASVSSGADCRAALRMLAHLSAVTTALDQVASALDLNYDQIRQQAVLARLADVMEKYASRDQVDPLDVLKALRRKTKHCVRDLAAAPSQRLQQWSDDRSSDGSQTDRSKGGGGAGSSRAPRDAKRAVNLFVFQLLMETSRAQPPVARRVALDVGDKGELVETCSLVPLDLGTEFLRTQGPRFAQHVEFMRQYHLLRPSDAKKEPQLQAMTINARVHSLHLRLKDGSMREVASVLRSGAFATHGRKPRNMGLAALVEMQTWCRQASLAMRTAVLTDAGFASLEALDEEVEVRRGCCVAQALPVVVQAVQDMCHRQSSLLSAHRSGSFLYVQHSLLSDLHPREGAYLQELKGALDEVSSRLQVRFVFKPERALEVQGRTIVLYLDRDQVPDAALPAGVTREELLSRSYSVTAVVFNCGVNVLQSLGFVLPAARGEIGQDVCNRQAMDRLNDYALQAGHAASPGLLALNRHYSKGARREAKDVESIWKVRVATRELGGFRAINCKSGKDRTAMEIAISFTQEAAKQVGLDALQQESLLESLQGGLSYMATSQNNGRPSAYAFTEFELLTLPPGWAPAWKLCGKVET